MTEASIFSGVVTWRGRGRKMRLSGAPSALKVSVAVPPSDSPKAGPNVLRSPANTLLKLALPLQRSQLRLFGLLSNPGGEGRAVWGLLGGRGLRE